MQLLCREKLASRTVVNKNSSVSSASGESNFLVNEENIVKELCHINGQIVPNQCANCAKSMCQLWQIIVKIVPNQCANYAKSLCKFCQLC